MTNYEKLTKTFPNIPDYSGLDIWGDFWDEEYQEPKEKEAMRVLSQRECETLPNHYERRGFCPKCHQVIAWVLNRSYCGFCGQKVKWND